MELKFRSGDYVADSLGNLAYVDGAEALLQRVLLRLTAHRGAFPFLTDFGSNLWLLGTLAPGERQGAAEQYAAEALADEENLKVESVTLRGNGDGSQAVTVQMSCDDQSLSVSLTVQ